MESSQEKTMRQVSLTIKTSPEIKEILKKLALSILTYCIMTTNVYAASGATILSDTSTLVLIVFFLLALVGLPRR